MKTNLTPNFIAKHCVANVFGETEDFQLSISEAMQFVESYDIYLVQIVDSLSLEVYLNLNVKDADQYDFLQDCSELEKWFY